MLDIFAGYLMTASRTARPETSETNQQSDTRRRYPWRGGRWKGRRTGRKSIARELDIDSHILNDIGLTQDNVDRLYD